jgi:hypothetical protein
MKNKMKNKILLSLVLGSVTAFSDTATLTEGVAVRLDVPASLLTVFVSYPGKIGNQCGVKLLELDETGADVENIVNNLVVRLNEEELAGPWPKYEFPQKVKDQSAFGAYLTIETRDGRNLSEVMTDGERELILVSTPCKL